jgi:hypothetical protein
MATRTLAYECKYCGALKRTKTICERHELTCFQNPDAKNCVLCQHMRQGGNGRVCFVTGKRCSVAVSANCHVFARRESNE